MHMFFHGYSKIDVCDQSPLIIQLQSGTPFRMEPVDGFRFLNFDLYNNVLGYGKALGTSIVKPDQDNPGKFTVVTRAVYTFPAN